MIILPMDVTCVGSYIARFSNNNNSHRDPDPMCPQSHRTEAAGDDVRETTDRSFCAVYGLGAERCVIIGSKDLIGQRSLSSHLAPFPLLFNDESLCRRISYEDHPLWPRTWGWGAKKHFCEHY